MSAAVRKYAVPVLRSPEPSLLTLSKSKEMVQLKTCHPAISVVQPTLPKGRNLQAYTELRLQLSL